MLDLSKSGIWHFALTFYQMPGVEADCLEAQDKFGLDVTALIFALYRSTREQGFDAGMAAELARTMSARIIEPLRAARSALKAVPTLVDPTANEALRQKVKVAELDAERLTLNALKALPIVGDALSAFASLAAIATASQVGDDPHLDVLLKRLAIAAQNM